MADETTKSRIRTSKLVIFAYRFFVIFTTLVLFYVGLQIQSPNAGLLPIINSAGYILVFSGLVAGFLALRHKIPPEKEQQPKKSTAEAKGSGTKGENSGSGEKPKPEEDPRGPQSTRLYWQTWSMQTVMASLLIACVIGVMAFVGLLLLYYALPQKAHEHIDGDIYLVVAFACSGVLGLTIATICILAWRENVTPDKHVLVLIREKAIAVLGSGWFERIPLLVRFIKFPSAWQSMRFSSKLDNEQLKSHDSAKALFFRIRLVVFFTRDGEEVSEPRTFPITLAPLAKESGNNKRTAGKVTLEDIANSFGGIFAFLHYMQRMLQYDADSGRVQAEIKSTFPEKREKEPENKIPHQIVITKVEFPAGIDLDYIPDQEEQDSVSMDMDVEIFYRYPKTVNLLNQVAKYGKRTNKEMTEYFRAPSIRARNDVFAQCARSMGTEGRFILTYMLEERLRPTSYAIGLPDDHIVINLTDVSPPEAILNAQRDVTVAKEGVKKTIVDAEGAAKKKKIDTEAEANARIALSEADATSFTNLAKGLGNDTEAAMRFRVAEKMRDAETIVIAPNGGDIPGAYIATKKALADSGKNPPPKPADRK